MNLTHVFTLGSPSLRRAHELGHRRELLPLHSQACFHITCRSSNGEARRGYGDERRGSNGVSERPRGSDGGGYRSSEGSRGNYRGSNGNYGRYKGSGAGHGRGRDRKKQMHPGAYSMVDEQTGEKVIVWGVETDDDIPVPTADDLNWKKTILAIPGDASDDVWAKVMENSGSSDGYSVKGVRQGVKDWTDELYEEDEDVDEDEEDDLFNEDEFESESDSGEEEVERVESRKVSRPARLKVFGRDVRGKSLLKVKAPCKEKNESASEMVNGEVLSDGGPSTEVQEREEEKEEGPAPTPPQDSIESRVENLVDEDQEEEEEKKEERSPTPPQEPIECINEELADVEQIVSNEQSSAEADAAVKRQDREVVPQKAEFSSSSGYSGGGPVSSEFQKDRTRGYEKQVIKVEATSTITSPGAFSKSADTYVEKARTKAQKNDRDPAPGEYYILDVTEDDDRSSSRQRQYEEMKEGRKTGLLDQLRLQATGKKPMSKDLVESRGEEPSSWKNPQKVGSQGVEAAPITPMRDMKARDNYDSSIAEEFFSQKSFRDVGATDEVTRALAYLQVDKPSQIQALSFTPILQGKSCIIAEQTGSGKTLAYVAPLVQRLKADEAGGMGKALPKKPRVLVLVPTSELASQVLKTIRALSKGGVPTRSIVLTGGFRWKTQVESLEQGADIVVATPGRLLQHLESGNIQFDHLKTAVFDEVDILFDDEDFSKALQTINKAASIKVQYVHVTATLPVDVHDNLLERYPDCLSVMGPSLHRTAPGLQEILVDCSGGEADEKTPESAFVNKRTALLQLVDDKPVPKTIIFCNKIETCRKVENILSRYDRTGKKIQILPYHAALSQEARLETLEAFMTPQPKQKMFLVCTDRASRGIDALDVEHVVLFDFPRDPSEYVRRVGRTARGAGGTGKVFVFVVGKQVSAARRIMDRNDKGYPIHDVPGDRYYYSN